jgi:hypothetical protein
MPRRRTPNTLRRARRSRERFGTDTTLLWHAVYCDTTRVEQQSGPMPELCKCSRGILDHGCLYTERNGIVAATAQTQSRGCCLALVRLRGCVLIRANSDWPIRTLSVSGCVLGYNRRPRLDVKGSLWTSSPVASSLSSQPRSSPDVRSAGPFRTGAIFF